MDNMENEKVAKIDKLILEASRSREFNRVAALRLIKAKYIEFLTAKNAKPLDDIAEMQILKKMADERKESIKIYEDARRYDLAEKELGELKVISEFLPKEPTEEELKKKIEELIELGMEPTMKNMGAFMKCVKEAYPSADGSKLSRLVKERLS